MSIKAAFLILVTATLGSLLTATTTLAGETEFGHVQRGSTSTFNVQGKAWSDTVENNKSQQIDVFSDQPAFANFTWNGGKDIKVTGSVGSLTADPVIGINVSDASRTKNSGTNETYTGVSTSYESFTGIRGIQTGTQY